MPDIAAFRALASTLDRIDVDVYSTYGKDPLEPIIGMGDRRCRLAVMGRDPGRQEVEHGVPFIGAAGQIVRKALYQTLNPGAPVGDEYDFSASMKVGDTVFWANTVPYKPIGNKAWGIRCKRSFYPLMADVLVHEWDGRDLIALGRDAVNWFGLNDKATKQHLAEFWEREDRYETFVEVDAIARDGTRKSVRVHPVPHPSPLNATWYKKVPGILTARLRNMAWTDQTWRLPG